MRGIELDAARRLRQEDVLVELAPQGEDRLTQTVAGALGVALRPEESEQLLTADGPRGGGRNQREQGLRPSPTIRRRRVGKRVRADDGQTAQ
jgi:hypothetical protein